MLLRVATLKGIRDGTIRLAFRRWRRPTVKAGGRLRTPIGELAIDAVDTITLKDVTQADARAAGFASRRELLDELRGREGKLYRVALRLAGPDARIALRASKELTSDELEAIAAKLARMDARSGDGPWTLGVLDAIAKQPGRRAADLAAELDQTKARFKPRVRRLKDLGLTESLEVGYRLSPRGDVVLRHLRRRR